MRHFLRRLPVSNAPLDPPKPLTGVAHPRSPLCKVEGEEQKFRKISKNSKFPTLLHPFDAVPQQVLRVLRASNTTREHPSPRTSAAAEGLGEFESYVAEKNNTTLWKKQLKSPPALRQCGADSSKEKHYMLLLTF